MFFRKKKKKKGGATSDNSETQAQDNDTTEVDDDDDTGTDDGNEVEDNNEEVEEESVEEEEEEEEKKSRKKKYVLLPIFLILIAGAVIMLRKNVHPIVELSSESLDFENNISDMSFTIKNVAKAGGFLKPDVDPLKFEIKTEAIDKWIKVHPDSGNCGKGSKSIDVTINRDLLIPGNHMGELRLSTNAGDYVIRVFAQKDEEKLAFTSPTNSAPVSMGKNVEVNWTASSGVSNSVNIYLYMNGTKIETIAKNFKYRKDNRSNGHFSWNLKNSTIREGNNYSLKIEDSKNPKISGEVGPISLFHPLTAIKLLNATKNHQAPSTVQFIFSLRNQNNHAILFDSDEVDWKNIKIWENEKEIDYLESHALLYTQDDFQLQVMLVLDFSASMYETKDDIKKMTSSVKDLIDNLNETHQIGVVEFHRPDKAPALLQPFTTYKEVAKEAIDSFSSGKIYRDFSICWDAVKKGLKQFPDEPDPNIFKTLLVLSDGFDNSSFCTPDNIIALANDKDVHIFVVGVGEVHEEDVLKGIALKTGGTYVHSENMNVLCERFKQSIKDVKGQYKIKYISPKKPEDGSFTVKSNITYKGVTGRPSLQDEIDPSSIFKKTINGTIRFSAPSVIKNNRAEIFMWCEHVPRYINEFRFWIDTVNPFEVYLTSFNDGGLCQDWNLTKEADGWYRLSSPNQDDPRQDLAFGDFGTICKIVVTDIKKAGFTIPFKMDNTIYDMGQAFYGKDTTSQPKLWRTKIHVGEIVK